MQNKPPHSNETTRLFGKNESFLKPHQWAEARIPAPLGTFPLGSSSLKSLPMERVPLERIPLEWLLCFRVKPEHIGHRRTGPTFLGGNMMDTHIRYLPIGSALWIAPYRPLPIGCVLSFFPKPAHIVRHCTGSFFQGKNIIITHLYPFAWFSRAFVCVVFVTAQTKALRDGTHAYRTHRDGHYGDA